MKYIVTEDIKSPNKMTRNIEVLDFVFVLFYMAIAWGFMGIIHEAFKGVYMLFSLAVSIFLTSKSFYNKKRRNYESMLLLIKRNLTVYRPYMGNDEEERK